MLEMDEITQRKKIQNEKIRLRRNPGEHQTLSDREEKRSRQRIPRRSNQRGNQTGDLGLVVNMISMYCMQYPTHSMCEVIEDISKEMRAVREIGFQRLQKSMLNICYEGPVWGGGF